MRSAAAVGGVAALGGLLLLLRRRRHESASPSTLDDDAWIAYTHAQRLQRKQRPSQSRFRVTAVVVFTSGSHELRHVVGHNDEACNLLNSVCAERAAFLQIAGRAEASAPALLEVLAVYITTDASHAITPGALCREYMSSSSWTSLTTTRIVMEGTDGLPSRLERTLSQLYPFASPYVRLDRDGQQGAGERLGPPLRRAREERGGREGTAWRGAVAASAGDARSDLHPVQYGACVVYDNGETSRAWQKKALEYGCSLDAVCQLCQAIEEHAPAAKPAMLCMADQFGVCHAPFATARAYLAENGLGQLPVLLHDGAGELRTVAADELLPGLPSWCS